MEAASDHNTASLVSNETERQTDSGAHMEGVTEGDTVDNIVPVQIDQDQGLIEKRQVDESDASGQANVNCEAVLTDSKDKTVINKKDDVPLEIEEVKEKQPVVENEDKENVMETRNDENQEHDSGSSEVLKENEKSSTATVDDSNKPVSVAENKSVQTPNFDPVLNKKIKKKDKSSAEEKKLVELLVHVFDGLETPEKKMEALAKKYIQLAADMKTTESKLEDVEGKHKEAKREKEQLQNDFIKVNMAKTKLESLCRELQKQNKIIKEEIQKRSDEEDRKRRELSQKFQSTINDITTQMGENHKRNQQLKQDNTDLAQKLKGLVEQYEVREQHIEKVLKAKQLELQLCEAKLQQQTNILQEERQNHLKEKHALLSESLEQEKKVEMLVKQEAELKGQLSLYTEKFVEFQSTLTKSNEVFATFKKEMDKMTKTIRKLEKESNTWKTRYENTNVSLVQMVEERTQKDNEISVQKGKVDKLEKLCRALQAERRKLKKELEQNDKQAKTANDGDSEDSAKTRSDENSPDTVVKNGEKDSCASAGDTAEGNDTPDQQTGGDIVETVKENSVVNGPENNDIISKSGDSMHKPGNKVD